MRQAGRYLPEYQEMRQRHSFVEMCTDPDLSVEVALQPYRRFAMDAAIVFYDILFLPQAMGAPLEFTEEGPRFRRPTRTLDEVRALHEPDLSSLDPGKGTGAVLESLRRLRAAVPPQDAVLGFAGAPFTLAAYLAEGRFDRSGDTIRRLLHEDSKPLLNLLERLSEATGDYLKAQVEAGATAVQLFDTWAGVLGPEDYREFALPYVRAALEKVSGAPTILYANGCAHLLEEMAAAGASVLSVDWKQPLADARRRLGTGIGLQGNLDPTVLFAPVEDVRRRTRATLESLRGDPGYIFNLGHGILPGTPVASVEVLVETVKGFDSEFMRC